MRLPPLYGAAIFQDTCVALIKKVRVGGVEPTLDSGTHSRMEHYFFSYLLNCEVYLIKVLEIMAQMLQYITFLSLKAIKVSSNFILNYLKKVVGGATAQKYQKQMLKP